MRGPTASCGTSEGAHVKTHARAVLALDRPVAPLAATANAAHGDLSLYTRGGAGGKTQLVMLDAGIVVELDDVDRESLICLFSAIVKGESEEAWRPLARSLRIKLAPPPSPHPT